MDSFRRGRPPELEDIAGSKHWDNMSDQGFVVHRHQLFNKDGTRNTKSILYHRKARFEELGYPTKLHFDYDVDQGRFVLIDPPPPKSDVKEARKPKESDYDER